MNFRKPAPQEMVQLSIITNMDISAFIDRNETASPFWRSTSANSPRDNGRQGAATPERKVVGAAYSHADMLKFDSLTLSGSSRPLTPPSLTRNKSSPPPGLGAKTTPPTRRTYTGISSHTSNAWIMEEDDNEADDDDDALGYDEDEDEFGLPSIASMRRKGKRLANKKAIDPGGGGGWTTASNSRHGSLKNELNATTTLAGWALDNGDVAEERAIPTYPSTKKSMDGQKILRPQYKDILRDPANSLHLISHPSIYPNASNKETEAHAARIGRINKFKKFLQASSIPLPDLRNAAWSGIPGEVRAMSWQLLLGYLPTSSERRVATLERKRKEYLEGVRQAFERGNSATDAAASGSNASPSQTRTIRRGQDEAIWHQISIDIPRTNPHLELYSYEATQRSLERILYLWAIRHPASGYVQGINDLVTPFWQVFLGQYITDSDVESGMDPGQLPKAVLDAVEADSFWCLTKLLDGIQDNYIHAQPGITRQVSALRDLTSRIDAALAKHMEKQGVEFIQFSFRWMNCLLMRELSVKNTIRMWDTYLAEDQGFSEFHLYVCAAFLVKWSHKLQEMDFQEIMMFLQSLPTKSWTEKDIELLMGEAYIWKSLFQGSKAHVRKTSGGNSGALTL